MLVPFPAGAKIKRIDWKLERPAQVNRSAWTGRRQVVTQAGGAVWRASVELCPIVGEANVLAWRAFLAKLRGQINTFRLPATEAAQFIQPAPTKVYDHHAAGVTAMTIAGPAFEPQLPNDYTIAVNGQLLRLVGASVAAAADLRAFNFFPALAAMAFDQTPVEMNAAGAYVLAPAGATSLTLLGPRGEAQFAAGQMIAVADQLLTVTDPSAAAGGNDLRAVAVEPPLRAAIAAHTRVERSRPAALVAMTSPTSGWSVDRGQIYGIAFEVEEAFAP